MRIYHYDKQSGEYTGCSNARVDPGKSAAKKKKCWLVPASATAIAPPTVGARQAAIFNGTGWDIVPDWRGVQLWDKNGGKTAPGITAVAVYPGDDITDIEPPVAGEREAVLFSTGGWAVVPDWRGVQLWNKSSGLPVESITEIDVMPDETMIDEPPPDDMSFYQDGVGWQTDLSRLFDHKAVQLKIACNAACRAGCVSTATGQPYTYETARDRDQLNLTALAMSAMNNINDPDWRRTVSCIDKNGVKSRVEHTATQLVQVAEEVQQMISDQIAQLYTLLDTLAIARDAGDEAGLLAVVWPS